MEKPGQKIEALESIRGLAALVVFLGHFVLAFAPQRHGLLPVAIPGGALKDTPLFFLINGTASVSLFFVLSGYVLSLGHYRPREGALAGAVVRRWPRLLPVALASTLAAFALHAAGAYRHVAAAEISRSDWLRAFGFAPVQFSPDTGLLDALAQGAFLVFFRSSADSWMNSSLWTMHLELVGSFVVFGLVAVVRGTAPRTAAGVFLATATVAYYANAYLPLFVAGAALAYVHAGSTGPRPAIGGAVRVLAIAGILVALGYIDPGTGVYRSASFAAPLEADLRVLVHGVASVALIHLVTRDPVLARRLSGPVPRWLGRISFPLYAFHLPLLMSLSSGVFVAIATGWGYRAALAGSLLVTLAVLLGISTLVAALDRRWCDWLRNPRRPARP